MGDYTKDGRKIGTCGNAYYATVKMLRAEDQTDLEVQYYLNPVNKCTFAFPFPEYEGKKIGQISNYHKGERVDFYFDFPTPSKTVHKKMINSCKTEDGRTYNLFTDCIYNGAECSTNIDKQNVRFRLSEQVYKDNGELWIIAECTGCGCKNVFDGFEALEVCNSIYKQSNGKTPEEIEYANHIAFEIASGYATKNPLS